MMLPDDYTSRETMRTRNAAALAMLVMAPLTACSTTSADSGGRSGTATTKSAPTAEPSALEARTGSPLLPLGAEWKWTSKDDTMSGRISVIGYQQPISSAGSAAQEAGAKGFVWGALEVEFCTDRGELSVTNADWTLAYDDGPGARSSSTTYEDFPKPEFPGETAVQAGTCTRGKIVYPVPGKKRPQRVVYEPSTGFDIRPTAEWVIPKR